MATFQSFDKIASWESHEIQFYFKTDYSKYESSKPSDTRVKASVTTKIDKVKGDTRAEVDTTVDTRSYYKDKRELKRRIRQAVHDISRLPHSAQN